MPPSRFLRPVVLTGVVVLLAACRPLGGVRSPADGGITEFDASIPRVALPSLAGPRGATGLAMKPSAPLLSTAPEGIQARFERLRIRGYVEGPLALTEIHVGLRNVEARTTETSFVVNLPPGGSVTRFAMRDPREAKAGWQEGRIAESASARETYERLLQRGVDPGLVEVDGPDRVRVRIFPMWASGTREVVLTVLHSLPRENDAYRLPLAGVQVTAVDAQVLVAGNQGRRIATFATDGIPVDDLVLPLRAETGFATAPVATGDHGTVARLSGLRPADGAVSTTTLTSATVDIGLPKTMARPPARHLVVAFDSSASRESAFAASVARLQAIASAAPPEATLDVAAFDQDVEPIYRGPAKGFGPVQTSRLLRRGALGTSNLSQAFAWIERTSQGHREIGAQVLVLTDGVHGAGPRTKSELAPLVKRVRTAGVTRITALLDRPERAHAFGGLAELGVAVEEPTALASDVLARLALPLSPASSLHVDGSDWYWPRKLTGAAAETLVFAEAPSRRSLTVEAGEQRYAITPTRIGTESSSLVDLAIAQARLRDLVARHDSATAIDRATLRREIVKRSLDSGVLTEHTAFVVLDPKEDAEEVDRDGRKALVVAGERATAGRARAAARLGHGASSADRDADGVPDQHDACPDEFADDEIEYEDADGCPRPENLVQIVNGRPGLLRQPVRFSGWDAEPSPSAIRLLQEMATALRQSPRVSLVEIGGHARALGTPAQSLKLADARANAVRGFLVRSGVAPDRLVVRPYGATVPRRPHDSAQAGENDRVELVVIAVDGRRRPERLAELSPPAQNGRYGEITALIADRRIDKAQARAREWRERSGDPLAFLALGDALFAAGDRGRAARAYGSFADVFAQRPTHWRIAAGFLDRLASADAGAAAIAADVYHRAHEARPSFIASARGLAYAEARLGRWEAAATTALDALRDVTPSRQGPLGDDQRSEYNALLRTDAAILGAAWARAEPTRRESIEQRLIDAGVPLARSPSLHVVATWENDASNVDLLVSDANGGAASPQARALRSGGELRLDVRTGYGPDWFAIDGRPTAGPYRIAVTYAARGAMGAAIGKVSIVEHDGTGRVTIDDRPFVLMNERATVDLGLVKRRPGS